MNPLQEYPAVRQWAYRVLWVTGLVLGAIQVYLLTTGGTSPEWLLGAVAVLGYVSIATNYTADRNVAKTTVAETPPEDRGYVVDEGGQINVREGLIILVLALLAIALVVWIVQAL